MLQSSNAKEIFISNTRLSKIAIPVAPPSKNPLGSKNAFKPILASMMPRKIWRYSFAELIKDGLLIYSVLT
jgi:hypothetical protein